MDTEQRYVTGPEAAEILGVHVNTIINLRRGGILTDLRIPGLVGKNRPGQGRYLRAEVEALANGMELPPVVDAQLESSAMYVLGHLPHNHGCAHIQEEALPCTCWKHQLRTLMLERLEENLSVEPE